MSTYKPVLRILTRGSDGLQPMLERAQYLQSLTQQLRNLLDGEVAEHISVANVRDQTAIITADSPAWVSRIRYLAPLLLNQLQSQPGLDKIKKIQFKVCPAGIPEKTLPPRTASLSPRSAEAISSAATGIGDTELSAALQRLSQRGKPESGS